MTNIPFYHFGLTGHPLGHSVSPKLHAAAFADVALQGDYLLFPVSPGDPDGLPGLMQCLRSGELHGLNVTIPHKQAVIPLVDELTPTARAIGAVNTIQLKDGKLIGHNTDAPGFWKDIQKILKPDVLPRAIIMGSGGASRAVVYALLEHGWDVTIAVRAEDVGQAGALVRDMGTVAGPGGVRSVRLDAGLASSLDRVGLVVNTTPLGMSPNVDSCAWPAGLELPAAAVYDVVYNPRETLLAKQARAAGLPAATGLGMLVEQAALAFELWTGRAPAREAMFAAVEA
jgi:shikimate dehydrogenase